MDSLFRSMGIAGIPSAMTLDEQGNVWVTMNLDGVYHYDLKKKQLHYLPQDDKMNHFSQGEVSSICVKNNFVWVLYASGLLERYNLTSGSVDIRNDFFVTATPFSTIQKNLFVDSDNDPWVYPGVGDMGVAYFETHSRQWTTMSKEQKPLSSYFVRSMAQEYSGTIWIANDHGGITLFDKKSGAMRQLLNDVNNARSVCQNSIISLYYDSQGVMWVGSYKNGVSYYHPNLYKFRQEIPMQQLHAKFKHLDCNVISADNQGRLWIGTKGQGLIRFDQNSGEIKHYKSDKDNPKTLSSDIITALKEDAQGVMWVGTFLGGLNAIMSSGNIIRYRPELNSPNYLSNKCVYDIYEDQNGYLWMAMLGSGIDRLNPERNRFDHYSQANTPGLMSDYMISLHRFNDTKLFASAAAGVSVIDTEKGTIETLAKATKVPELDHLYQVNSVMTDSRGIIWV